MNQKVIVGIPSGDMIHADFASSLIQMMIHSAYNCSNTDMAIINEKTSLVHKGRNKIVTEALKIGADKILFIDSDMTFPEYALKRLLDSGREIIGCDYMRRRPPYKNTTKGLSGDYLGYMEGGIKEVSYIGTGLLLVDCKVFQKIWTPFFDTKWDECINDFVGEDYMFCEKARQHGFNIYCDLDLSKDVCHLGVTAISKRMFVKQ